MIVWSDVIKKTTPVARKEHKCILCGCNISVGTKYLKSTGKNDYGYYSAFETHIECEKIADFLDMWECQKWSPGLDVNNFRDYIALYIHTHHRDKETEEIEDGWNGLLTFEAVKEILEENNIKV